MKPHAAPVARLPTHLTAFPTEEPEAFIIANSELRERGFTVSVGEGFVFFLRRVVRFFARAADGLREPLSQHSQEGVGKKKRVHLHLQESRNRLHRTVRVQGTQDKMSGE